MIIKYKREISILVVSLVLCLSIFTYIKTVYFADKRLEEPLETIISYYNNKIEAPTVIKATTKIVPTKDLPLTVPSIIEETIPEEEPITSIPYEIAPVFVDDGSIIYDGMTLTELTDKLNKSLDSYLTNTGYFFAKFTKDNGIDPYLSVAIVLLETGCKWNCSTLTRSCNNIGGLKGGTSCNGGSYRKYDTLEEGIEGYLNVIYNTYYMNGMDTPEKMASTYAASPTWAQKVRTYMDEIKVK